MCLGRIKNSLIVVVAAVVVALKGLPFTVIISEPLMLEVAGIMSVSWYSSVPKNRLYLLYSLCKITNFTYTIGCSSKV